MTKPLASIQELENDDEDLYLINLIDRYAARPDQLENICLAEFAANYDIKYSQTSDEENDHTLLTHYNKKKLGKQEQLI